MEKSKQMLSDHDGSSIDRLSDSILCHILSFLPTKLSVATSILSKKWRFLWAFVPNLEFGVTVHDTELEFYRSLYDIYQVLLHYRAENMNSFKFYCADVRCTQSQLRTCIAQAVVRNVKILDLSVVIRDRIPSCIFNCETLVELRLFGFGFIPMDGDVCLPALKKLSLDSVIYESDESLSHLLSGCSVLEELVIDRIDGDGVVCFCVSSPTLKRLILSSCLKGRGDGDNRYRVKIDTPALRYLEMYDSISKDVSAGELTNLLEARVCINNAPIRQDLDNVLDNGAPIEGDVLYSRSVLKFVGSLCNVKCLKLSTGWMQVPDSEFSIWAVKFHNLTKIVLADDGDWRFIQYFLENADNLEFLIIRLDHGYMKNWMEPKQVPACLLLHLGTVIIYHFGCTEQEFNMVRYILRNAIVLKRMEIHSTSSAIDLKVKFEALKRISLFKRGSVECELAFHR